MALRSGVTVTILPWRSWKSQLSVTNCFWNSWRSSVHSLPWCLCSLEGSMKPPVLILANILFCDTQNKIVTLPPSVYVYRESKMHPVSKSYMWTEPSNMSHMRNSRVLSATRQDFFFDSRQLGPRLAIEGPSPLSSSGIARSRTGGAQTLHSIPWTITRWDYSWLKHICSM